MNDVVERVARAICVAMGDDPDREGPDWAAEAYGSVARAAIEAMREPSPQMLRAGASMIDDEDGDVRLDRAKGVWWTMSSAALADASPDIGKEGIGNDVR